jgi:hypothetical protein
MAAPAPNPNEPITLRLYLEEEANARFPASTDARPSVADVPVDSYEIDLRLAAMKRALVAHQALNNFLSRVGVDDLPKSLISSIETAEALDIVSHPEGRWLRHINKAANQAKHECNFAESMSQS